MSDTQWFDSTVNVRYLHPTVVERGMRMAREVQRPTGPNGEMRPHTELTPVWDISIGPSGGYHGSRYLFRLSTGERRSAQSNDRVPVDLEITPDNLPPRPGEWITNQPFDEKAGLLGDRFYYVRSREIEKWVSEAGTVYRLLYARNRKGEERWSSYWVCRWDKGAKWLGPSRATLDGASAQLDAIREGRGW